MNTTKVKTVLQSSFSLFQITLKPPKEQRLKEMIENISDGKALVQLPYLQVYLDTLYREDYLRTYGKPYEGGAILPLEFTQEEIFELGHIEEVLSKFLDYQEEEIQNILRKEYPEMLENTVPQIIDAFVTNEGTKRPIAYQRKAELIVLDEKIKRRFPPVSNQLLSACLQEFEKARIIRLDDNYMELAHDSLAALLTEKRGAAQQLRKRLAYALEEYELSGGKQFLAEEQLLGMAEMLPKLHLDNKVHDLIDKSKKEIEKIKLVEKKKQEHKLQLVQDRLASEERARRRQYRLIALLGTFFLLAIVFVILGKMQEDLALRNLEKAQEAQREAVHQAEKARKAQAEAEKQTGKARKAKKEAEKQATLAKKSRDREERARKKEEEALEVAEYNLERAIFNLKNSPRLCLGCRI